MFTKSKNHYLEFLTDELLESEGATSPASCLYHLDAGLSFLHIVRARGSKTTSTVTASLQKDLGYRLRQLAVSELSIWINKMILQMPTIPSVNTKTSFAGVVQTD